MLTHEQWTKIDAKYGRLMYKISHQISGDGAICSIDDNLQDLRIAAMEAVAGFEKQNAGANGKFDEFWGSKGFDQYIKTCLWTKKNNKGARITKQYPITKGTVSTDKEEVLNIVDKSADPSFQVMLDDFNINLSAEQKSVISMLVNDPKLIKPSGKVNVKRVSETMECSWLEADKIIKSISKSLGNDL